MTGKRLYRSVTEKRIAGVCGGIAEHFDVDPVFIRLGTVLFTIVAPPVGVLGYIACWLIVPLGPESGPVRHETHAEGAMPPGAPVPPGAAGAASAHPATGRSIIETDGSMIGGLICISIGVLFLMVNLGVFEWEIFHFWRWKMVWPLLLIVVGIMMLFRAVTTFSRTQEP